MATRSDTEGRAVYSGIEESSMDLQSSSTQVTPITVKQQSSMNDQTYYSFTSPLKMPETGIKIENLSDFVLSMDAARKKYAKEFENLPKGMIKPHKTALKNRGKNKYKDLYAYDDTRVVLDKWNPRTETDYINACYIHGFRTARAYIASQGPISENLDDFWRMIWQTNSGKIVMLTNLVEEGKMKCIQYWPDDGTTAYGAVTVTLESSDIFSNFVIRTLSVSKDKVTRQVLQFHFTAWPDRGVPKYSSALVHFWSKVKNMCTACKGPVIVHCSAGIGRTGTFIALDYLTDQGRELGMVDVAGCVETLRRQRVNMVQTQEQYIFVHQALVETLTLSTSALPTSKFPNTFQDLLTIDPKKKKRKIKIEFEMLGNMTPTMDENQYSTAKEVAHREKNRYSNVLPVEEFMPSLYGRGHSSNGGYINAAFLPSYKEPNALIITQTPLESTKEDFWMMVYHQQVHTIVMMNDVSEMKETEVYWPCVKESVRCGNFEIVCELKERQGAHTVLTLVLKKQDKDQKLKLIQFGGWGQGDNLPESPSLILSCLELVQDWQRQTGNQPVLVHCMDGVKKSGLFCVLYAVLERTMIEHDVAIPQVIQEMRNRREQIIPSVEQFQFCHEVVLAFLEQFDTYSNFAQC